MSQEKTVKAWMVITARGRVMWIDPSKKIVERYCNKERRERLIPCTITYKVGE